MMQSDLLWIDGDDELAWTGKSERKLFLAYYCSYWNEDGDGGIAVHEFDKEGRHCDLRFLPVKKVGRRDPLGDIAMVVESWYRNVDGFHGGPIEIREFEAELSTGKRATLVRNEIGDAVLLPRELRFDQTKSGRVTLDFELIVRRTP